MEILIRRYEAIKPNGKHIKTQYSPTVIMLVTEMVEKKCSVDEIIRVTVVSGGSINYIASLDPLEEDV